MSLNTFLSSIAGEFSGKKFSTEDLLNFISSGDSIASDEVKKKGKKEKKEPKKIKMTVRQYMMTQETDVYKVKVTDRVAENKAWNTDHAEEIEAGEEDKKPENFFTVLSSVQYDLTDEEEEHIKEKVQEYNEEHFGNTE
jgi:hypothetical protein